MKSTRTRPGNTYLKGTLGIAAIAVTRTTDTFLATRYKRVESRRGRRRALVAVQHPMLAAIESVREAVGELARHAGVR